MNIRDNMLNDYIFGWDSSLKWQETKNELPVVREVLKNLALHNGGNIYYDKPLARDIEESYIIDTIEDAVGKVMHLYADSIEYRDGEYYFSPVDTLCPAFDFLEGGEFLPRININTAGAKELKKLPDIGPITIERILAYREEHGDFKASAEICRVQGIGEKTFEKINPMITVDRQSSLTFLSPALLQFKKGPSFKNYIQLLKGSRGVFTFDGSLIAGTTKTIIIRELKKIEEYIGGSSYPEYGKYHRVRASKIMTDHEIARRADALAGEYSTDLNGAALIDDSSYMFFVNKALATAKKRVYIAMFFMRFEKEGKYPTDIMMEELVRCKQRGVEIKIILDKDAEGDCYGSRIINKNAYDFFNEQGIDVTYDFEGEVTHSKVVIIDDAHVIVGSHNWTAGSFFAYDDKSLYIESPGLNRLATDRFLKNWHKFTADMTTSPTAIKDLVMLLSDAEVKKLNEAGIDDTYELLSSAKSPGDRQKLSQDTGIPAARILKTAKAADLLRVKHIHEKSALALIEAGVETVPDLAQQDPEELFPKLIEIVTGPPVSLKIEKSGVARWIETAKTLGALLDLE